MKVRFEPECNSFVCTEPIEQMVFNKDKNPAGWILAFGISAEISAESVLEIIRNRKDAKIYFEGERDKDSFCLEGYNQVSSCYIKHFGEKSLIDFQFIKPFPLHNTERGDKT